MFPDVGMQTLSALVHFIGLTILTFFITRRVLSGEFSWRGGTSSGMVRWPRLCVLLVFLDSYLFMLSSGILVFGVGLQTNAVACAAGIFVCVLFYASSKILIYLFLTEKVYLVWGAWSRASSMPNVRVVPHRVDQFRPGDGACVLGLRPIASIPLLIYDLYINILLTALFLWPILRSEHGNAQLKARRDEDSHGHIRQADPGNVGMVSVYSNTPGEQTATQNAIKSVGAFFPMRELSGKEREFKIQVTTSSYVDRGPDTKPTASDKPLADNLGPRL
ncbi:hypothetical protein C8F01DRAFT_1249868 [Mycena amicta]|nr:hypothetical protein C8F01DRAFT_1249868 [Mycena amicta]